MRRLLLLILLLPLPLASQVKILMPVVVKDATGKPATDLKVSEFQVSGPKNISIERVWLVPPATVSKEDSRTPVFVLYDAPNAVNPNPDLTRNALRTFLETVAKTRAPVTFYINTTDGLRPIYDSATPPEVLSAALALTENPHGTSSDPTIDQQARKLDLLRSNSYTHIFALTIRRARKTAS